MASSTTKREDVLNAAKDEDSDLILDLMKKHLSREDPFNLQESLESFSNAQLTELWDHLRLKTSFALLGFENTDSDESQPGGKIEMILNTVVAIGSATITLKDVTVPQSLYETAVLINGVIIMLPEDMDKLKNNIAKFCELWWSAKLTGRENLAANTLIFLFHKALLGKGTMADVKRIWNLRDCISEFDLCNESSLAIRESMIKASQCTVFIKSDQGRKLLSQFLGQNADLIDAIHKAIQENFSFTTKTMAESYGEIYFKAWKMTEAPIQEKIEICIQDFMFHAVNTKRKGALSPLLRKFLGYLHQQKKLKGVDEMLLRLYDPIIWRSFKVANSNVRANATGILIDVFPLRNPEAGVAEVDELLQKQFDILNEALDDPCHVVRCIAVEGVCYICNKYWEMIPSQTSQDLLFKLIHSHARDGASADVRLAVVHGFTLLLDNLACQPLLKTVLPELQNLFHDSSEKVRVAMCELLMKVKKLRAIKFYSIVPAPHLLARMEVDITSVVRRLVSLLFDNYMPEQKENESTHEHRAELLRRCMTMVDSNPGAARQFYKHAIKHMTLSKRVQFMTLICRCVLETVRKAEQNLNENENTAVDEAPNENEDDEEDELSIKDTDTLNGLLEIIVIMWTGSITDIGKPDNQETKEIFEKKMSKAIPEFFRVFQDAKVIATLTMLAGLMPSSLVPVCSRSTLSKLKNFKREEHTEDEYGMMLVCMCKWNKADELLELISDWLETGLKLEDSSQVGKNRKRSRGVAFIEPVQPQPMLALDYLNHMVQQVISREILLRSYKKDMENISQTMKRVKEAINTRLTSETLTEEEATDEFLLNTLSMYMKLEVLLHNTAEGRDSTKTFEEALLWAEADVIPHLKPSAQPKKKKNKRKLGAADATLLMDPTSANETLLSETLLNQNCNATLSETMMGPMRSAGQNSAQHKLASDVIEITLQMSSNMLLVGIGTQPIGKQLSSFVSSVATLDELPKFLPVLCKLMSQLTNISMAHKWYEEGDDIIPGMVTNFVQMLASLVKNKKEQADRILPSLKSTFGALLGSYHRNCFLDDCNTDIMSSLVDTIISELSSSIKSDPRVEENISLKNLPTLSSFLMSLIVRKSSMNRLFLMEIQNHLGSESPRDPESLVAFLVVIGIIIKGRSNKGDLKECIVSLEDRLGAINLENVPEDASLRTTVSSGKRILLQSKGQLGLVM